MVLKLSQKFKISPSLLTAIELNSLKLHYSITRVETLIKTNTEEYQNFKTNYLQWIKELKTKKKHHSIIFRSDIKKEESYAARYLIFKLVDPKEIQDLNISLSHSDGYVAICMSKDVRTGIDLELKTKQIPQKVLDRISNKTDSDSRLTALQSWLLREACYKCMDNSEGSKFSEFKIKAKSSPSNYEVNLSTQTFKCKILDFESINIAIAICT